MIVVSGRRANSRGLALVVAVRPRLLVESEDIQVPAVI